MFLDACIFQYLTVDPRHSIRTPVAARPGQREQDGVRICDSKGRTCKEVGAINTWTQRKQGDEVFKEYRREYKKRFARINAGKLTKSAFYAWSEEARKKKEDCDSGAITPEEFSQWLKESYRR